MVMITIKNTETEKEVLKAIKSRWRVGRKRYKEGIEHTQQPDSAGWIQEAIEEAADMLQYLVALQMKLREELNRQSAEKELLDKINAVAYRRESPEDLVEIRSLLSIRRRSVNER